MSFVSIKISIILIFFIFLIISILKCIKIKNFNWFFSIFSLFILVLLINIYFISKKEVEITNIYLNNEKINHQVNQAIKNKVNCKNNNDEFCLNLTNKLDLMTMTMNKPSIKNYIFIDYIKDLNKEIM